MVGGVETAGAAMGAAGPAPPGQAKTRWNAHQCGMWVAEDSLERPPGFVEAKLSPEDSLDESERPPGFVEAKLSPEGRGQKRKAP